MENWASSLPKASERPEINYIETSIIAADFNMGSQTLCNLFNWAHAGLDHCNHGKKPLWRVGLSCSFHICQFDLEECKINETFQAQLYVNHYLLCFMPFSHLQHTRCQRCLSSWDVVLGTLHSRSRECSCQEDFTSQKSTYLWLGFTSAITPHLRTVLLKTKILFSQKEGKEWAPKISTGTFLWNFK